MVSTLSAASMAWVSIVIDVVAVAIVLLFLIIGVKKGMMKMGFQLIASVAAIALAVFTVMPITNAVADNTTWDNQLGEKLEPALSRQIGENARVSVKYYADPENPDQALVGYEVALANGDVGMLPFDSILDDAGVFKLLKLQKVLEPVYRDALDEETARLQSEATPGGTVPAASVVFVVVLENYLATLIIAAIGFIVLCIVYRILLGVVGWLLNKAVRRLYIANFLDRTLGAVFGAACGLVLVFVIVTVLQLLCAIPAMDAVASYLANTKLVHFLMDKNFLYGWLAGSLGLNK